MHRYFFFLGFLFLSGCCEDCDLTCSQVVECGNPCQEFRPLYYPVSTLLQAYYGSAIGRSLPLAERARAAQAMQDILKYGKPGETTEWESPDLMASGKIQVYRASQGGSVDCQPIFCRHYAQEIFVNDEHLIASGKACEDIYHIWRIVEEAPSLCSGDALITNIESYKSMYCCPCD